MRKLRWPIGSLLFMLLLAACRNAPEPGAEKQHQDKAVQEGYVNESIHATSNDDAGQEAVPADSNVPDGAASSDGRQLITDIAGWDHPAKAILQGAPFYVSKVELSQDATYPVFYVSFPGEPDLADHTLLWNRLRDIAEANGYRDYKLVNGKDGVTVEVTCDAAAKTVTAVTVNGVGYPSAESQSPQAGPKVPQTYLDFMKENRPLSGRSEIGFFVETDLNGDGQPEAVLGVKDQEDGDGLYTGIYVLKQTKGRVVQLGDNLAAGGYGVYEIELVRLSDRKSPVVETKLTNGVSMEGFELFGLKNGAPVRLASSASPTGVGEDALVDADQNGDYDGYVQHRTSYDVLFYDVTRTYSLQQGAFVQTGTIVTLPDYPADAEGVVTHYFSLRALARYDDAPEVQLRLKEICPACAKAQTALIGSRWLEAFRGSSAIVEDFLDIRMRGNGKTAAAASVTFRKDDAHVYRLDFHLKKTDGKWVIDGIKRPAAK